MSNPLEEKHQGVPAQAGGLPEVDLSDLPSAVPAGTEIERKQQVIKEFARGIVTTEMAIRSDPSQKSRVKVVDGVLQVNQEAVEAEIQKVSEFYSQQIKEAIAGKDRSLLDYLLWYLKDQQTPEALAFIRDVNEAFEKGDASNLKLDALDISLPKRTMAERRIIKQELRNQLKDRFSLTFKDASGNVLPFNPDKMDTKGPDNEVDFVLVQDKGKKGFKLVIASEKGIGKIAWTPQDKRTDKHFQYPLPSDWSKDSEGTFTIPISSAADGEEPLFTTIEIRREPMKLTDVLNKQEEEEEETYTPPPQAATRPPPAQPRVSRPTTYVSVSH